MNDQKNMGQQKNGQHPSAKEKEMRDQNKKPNNPTTKTHSK